MKVLVVVDMQNDFVDGALGTKEAEAIVPEVAAKIEQFEGDVYYTRDTHETNYLKTQEGIKLPVEHCIKGTKGWQLCKRVEAVRKQTPVDKDTFASVGLAQVLKARSEYEGAFESITLVGLCTDICVIANAMVLKAFLPETEIIVDASCCAGVTPESHRQALGAMKMCQIAIEND